MCLCKAILLSIFAKTLCYVNLHAKNVDGIVDGNLTLECATDSEYLLRRWARQASTASIPVSAAVKFENNTCKPEGFLTNRSSYKTECNETEVTVTLLHLTAVQHGDTWTCNKVFSNGTIISSNALKLNVKAPVLNVTLNAKDFVINKNQDCLENEKLSFECTTVQGRPPPNIYWFIGTSYQNVDINVTYQSSCSHCNLTPDAYDITKSELSLNISKFFDQRWLFCNASNVQERLPVHSQHVILNVGYPPSVEDIPETKVIEGLSLNKVCNVTPGNPANFSLTWSDSDGKNWKTKMLNITKVNRTEAGKYKCSVNNTMKHSNGSLIPGYSVKAFTLYVLYPPTTFVVRLEINDTENNITTNRFSIIEDPLLPARFNCFADSNPASSKYYWSGVISSNTALLEVQRSRNYSGSYSCFAFNTMTDTENYTQPGNGSLTFYLEFLYPPELQLTENISVIEKTNFTTECKAVNGNPTGTEFQWNSSYGTKEELKIANVNRSSEGTYSCIMKYYLIPTYGKPTKGSANKTLLLDVLYPPEQMKVSLTLNSDYKNTHADINITFYVNENTSLSLHCSALGKPLPNKYNWSGIHTSNDQILTFTANRNTIGNVTCEASNTMKPTNKTAVPGNCSRSYKVDVLYPPHTKTINNQRIQEGHNVTVACPFEQGRTTNFSAQWISESGNLVKSEHLAISEVNRTQRGNYTCQLNFTMAPTYGDVLTKVENISFSLEVLYPPENVQVSLKLDGINVVNVLEEISVIENDSVTMMLNCTSDGNPKPAEFTWIGVVDQNETLLEIATKRNMSGYYTCIAKNTMDLTDVITAVVGKSNRTYRIDVLYPPVFKKLGQQSVLEGQMLTVSCAEEGKAAHQTFQWFTSKYEQISVNNTVTIVNITRDHAGNYTCEMNYALLPTYGANVTRRDNRSFHLDVLYPPENITITLTGLLSGNIDVSDTLRIIENGSTLIKFNCSATANPEPSSYWSGPKHSLDATLVLGATRDLSGKYTCHVSNLLQPTFGEVQTERRNKTVIVDFLYPPEVTKYKEEIVNVGNPVTKDCIVHQGNVMNMTVIWQKDNRILASDRYLLLENVTTSDKGQYNCTVSFTMNPTYGSAEQKSIQTGIVLNVRSELDAGQQTGDKTGNSSNTVAAIIGAVTAAVLVGFVVVGIAVAKKRGLLWFYKKDKTKESHEYENVAFNTVSDSKHDKGLPALPPPEEQEVEEDGIANNIAETEFYDPEVDNPYVNDPNATEIHRISVSELIMYVSNKTREYFYEEFENFPKGLVSTIRCTVAKRPEYVHLNRYQGIYPYDHSRVQISEQPDFFINANYIDGYTRRREYIASLGPTERHTLGFKTFWNMVWFEKSDVIVMLTHLTEPSGMKCEQYWPECGKNVDVDDILIQSETEEVAAEYTVRTFTVSKDEESRLVTQLHYTAWPDKTVPESVTSLIEFRQRVKAAPTRSLGPLVVHCSAGVGRTGTYIALDRLIEEGNSTDYVNVFDCVMSMRKQRVNMVQTPEQYVYLHQALVYCLAFDIEPVTAETVGEYIRTTSNNVFSQLYQQLKQTVEKVPEEYIEAQNKHASFTDWNRPRADIPGDRHRVLLSLDKEFGQSNYINAVYLASFLRQDHFIIAQSPLPKTVEDFVGMLYQEKSACIVALDDYRQKGTNNATYLPAENEQISYGYFSISCLSVEAKPTYVVRKLKLSHAGKHEQGEKVAYHFEFTSWKHDEKMPKDPKIFVEFVREIEDRAKESTEEDPHVIVHCMSASDRSGLFCAVSNLIQKMELEQKVSVVNMLRRVRERRRTAISSLEQLKFCYHAVFAFVKKIQHQSTRKKSSLMHYENGV